MRKQLGTQFSHNLSLQTSSLSLDSHVMGLMYLLESEQCAKRFGFVCVCVCLQSLIHLFLPSTQCTHKTEGINVY